MQYNCCGIQTYIVFYFQRSKYRPRSLMCVCFVVDLIVFTIFFPVFFTERFRGREEAQVV